MLIRSFIFITLFFSFSIFAQDRINWGAVASIDTVKITKIAESYLAKEAEELKGFNLKVLEVSASLRNGGKGLFASFFHKNSYIEGSDEVVKIQTPNGEIDHPFITFDIVVVEFDGSGNPFSYRILGKKYPGTVEDFQKEFSEQYGEH